jgi:hypothetical protein
LVPIRAEELVVPPTGGKKNTQARKRVQARVFYSHSVALRLYEKSQLTHEPVPGWSY